jgi:hypothetical protein
MELEEIKESNLKT